MIPFNYFFYNYANNLQCSAGVKKQRLEVHGTKGSIVLIDDNTVKLFDHTGATASISEIEALVEASSQFTDVEGEMFNLFNVLRNGAKLGVTAEEAFHHLAFVAAAVQSAQTQQIVKIPQP